MDLSGQNGPKCSILVHFGLANAKIRFGIRSFWPKWLFGPFWSSTLSDSTAATPYRTHEKTIPLRTKIFILTSHVHSRVENFLLDWKFQSQTLFFCGQRGARNEKPFWIEIPFRIESLIFSIWPLEIDFFSILGPSGNPALHNYWARGSAERTWGEFFILAWRTLGKFLGEFETEKKAKGQHRLDTFFTLFHTSQRTPPY